jgi:uncharacterized protein YihD (DUF1040 family)
MLMGNLMVTLYVKSVRTATRVKNFGVVTFATQHVGQGITPPVTFDSEAETKYEFILPEEQLKVVEMVQKVASEHGLDVEVIDVGRENVVHRLIQTEVKKLKTFPTLVLSSGERIEGSIARKELEAMLVSTRNNPLTH